MRNTMPKIMIALLAVALTAVAFAGMATNPPETITINEAQAKKPPVVFPHKAHFALVDKCATCHHTQEGLAEGANVEVKLCSACHLDPEKAETPSMRQMSLSKNPFHKLCIDCHKAEAKGPKTCNDCHKK